LVKCKDDIICAAVGFLTTEANTDLIACRYGVVVTFVFKECGGIQSSVIVNPPECALNSYRWTTKRDYRDALPGLLIDPLAPNDDPLAITYSL